MTASGKSRADTRESMRRPIPSFKAENFTHQIEMQGYYTHQKGEEVEYDSNTNLGYSNLNKSSRINTPSQMLKNFEAEQSELYLQD